MLKKRKISWYRQEYGYSQMEVAKILLVTQQSISSWETGRTIPKPHQMKQLAIMLGVEMEELFSDVFNIIEEEKKNVL